ncbi:Nicotinamidase-related amidase [Burkholderia sp. YR290]|jgi:nicotinamidase-related amidase|uniref:isochorismatase family cysteine hydrolase n=1 Tax=Paraburkholderia hospita TaxID=169430 RepID=UPI0009A8DA12|nr:isochorismatase family cysteine hydrolase [Paraburkholderia hospita]SKC90003.1 Nicotinamidase-related amidase [Paraburkholderia hospita]SOE86218.1 Nicotinamidase-related amidase [Burkholderia sp. YR290]
MPNTVYRAERTGLLLVDPYNDFLSEGGKLFPMIKEIATNVRLLDNLRETVAAARKAGIQVFYVPHRRWQPGDYDNWDHPNPTQRLVQQRHTFAKGTWGGEWHPDFVPQEGDIIVQEHWAQSGFANTDLDFQLKQQGVTHVIAVGLLANTCIESTGRFAMELGYHVTLVRDGTAAFSEAMMRAAHELNGPTFAHEILTTAELIAALPAVKEAKGAQA